MDCYEHKICMKDTSLSNIKAGTKLKLILLIFVDAVKNLNMEVHDTIENHQITEYIYSSLQ